MRPLENLFTGTPWTWGRPFQGTAIAELGLSGLAGPSPPRPGSARFGIASNAPRRAGRSPDRHRIARLGPASRAGTAGLTVLELPGATIIQGSTPGPSGEDLPLLPDPAPPLDSVSARMDNRAGSPPTASPDSDATETSPTESVPAPPTGTWTVAEILTVLWLAGAVLYLLRVLIGLAALERCRQRAVPIREGEWAACLEELVRQHGLRTEIELRESGEIGSPLTLGLRRPVILLPRSGQDWTAEQRTLILRHELAHIRRGDFLTALLAKVAASLYWFHPLVRWLAGRLRLEQEFAADAWVASAVSDTKPYLRCLARLALAMDPGTRSLAPAFWRRRPEIMRRIHMLRENRSHLHLGTRSRWVGASLALGAYVLVAGLGYLHSADPVKAADPKAAETKISTDLYGDPLPAGALQRLGTARFRHNSTAIAYSPDGKMLASGGRDNTIRLLDAATGKEIRRMIGHKARSYSPARDGKSPLDTLVGATGEGGVNSVDFSPDGKLLASGGWDDTVRIWDVQTGKELRKIDAHKAMVGRVVFSPNGKVLASRGALDGTVRLWDPITGTQLQKFVGLSKINPWRFNHDLALAISPDSKTVATTARNALILFDIGSGAEVKRLPSNVYGITVAYSPDGKLLATGGVDPGDDVYSLRIWDVAAGKELRKCTLPKNEPPTYLSWDPNNNGRFAAVVAEDDMHIFDANTGKEVVRLKHYWPSRVIYSRDGKTLASAGSGPTIRHWDAATGKELHLDFQGHQDRRPRRRHQRRRQAGRLRRRRHPPMGPGHRQAGKRNCRWPGPIGGCRRRRRRPACRRR